MKKMIMASVLTLTLFAGALTAAAEEVKENQEATQPEATVQPVPAWWWFE